MKRKTILILIAGLCVSGLCCLACCLGILNFGVHALAEEIRFQLEADPNFVRHVGAVKSFEINYLASLGNHEDQVYAYDVTGDKWSGRMTIKQVTNDNGAVAIVWARFTLPSGETIELPAKQKQLKPEAKPESEPVPVDSHD
jgi:hypothetical protein